MTSTLESIVTAVGRALQPLRDAVEQQPVGSGLVGLFEHAGILDGSGPRPDLSDACRALQPALEDLASALDPTRPPAAVNELSGCLERVSEALASVAAPGLADAGKKLLGYLLATYLADDHPRVFATLRLAGLVAEAGPTERYFRPRVDLDRLGSTLTGLNAAVGESVNWGGEVNFALLLDRIQETAVAFGFPAVVGAPEIEATAAWTAAAPGADPLPLHWALASIPGDDARGEAGVQLIPVRRPHGGDALALSPYGLAAAGHHVDLGDQWSLVFAVTAESVSAPAVVIAPEGVKVCLPDGDATPISARVSLTISRGQSTGQHLTIASIDPVGRIDIGTLRLLASVDLGENGVGVELSSADNRLVVGSGTDGFLAKVLPQDGLSVPFELGVGWSSRHGLHFVGSAGLSYDLPSAVQLGPVRIDELRFAVTAGAADTGAAVAGAASVSLSCAIGPFSAAIKHVSLRAAVNTADTDTTQGAHYGLGRLELALDPPSGVGIAIDAAAVKGGGFLLFDEDAGRYAGVFELTLLDTISVKAIAIVNTRNPDGTPGFALLVMITAEGFAPVPLGMGFTLTGIGGLLAINHTFDAKAITDGLRSGVLDSILFVKDPVKNISRVLGTLDKVFPIAQDRLVVGPLAEISWGTPTMVRIRLALVLELPQPVRVALLAAITVQLPDPKVPVVDLHIDAAGILDLGRRTFALDASLHDSKIAGFTLTGDMSLRLGWGDDPGFLASFGGFHPKFKPPPDVRPLQRLALSLTSSDNPRVRFEAYLAVTSNTLQLGARADVHAEAAGLALDAGGSFDALLQLVPFSLDVAFAAWARISAGGSTLLAISISVDVTGPAPWHITGQATISILFISATVGIDLTVGEAPAVPPVLESVDVGDAIWSQLGDPARWEAALPAATRPGAILLSGGAPSDGTPLVAHPLSRITARQQAAPLDHRVDCVGARVPARGSRTYTATVGTTTGVTSTAVQDQFAPAQFQKLTQDQQLTAPSFVPMNSGVALTPAEESASGPRLSWDFALQTLDVTSLDEPASPGPAVAATDATARGPVDPAADLAQTVTVAAS